MLFAIVRKRTIASVHGSQSLLSCSQWSELHNSHFITAFSVRPVIEFRPTGLEVSRPETKPEVGVSDWRKSDYKTGNS